MLVQGVELQAAEGGGPGCADSVATPQDCDTTWWEE